MPLTNAEPVNKEVVVIGNGPSAITLSYLLSGHAPYYRGFSNDEYLHTRLSENADDPLVLQDLEFLSDGLEGRSTNPVSILFDALAHPDADLGNETPSLLEWKSRQDLQVDHVVLGQGPPGGAWKMMTDSDLLTVSLGTWMELPDLTFSQWRPNIADLVRVGGRINVATVAEYYSDYVRLKSLSGNFQEGTWVTSVRKLSNCSPFPEAEKKLVSQETVAFEDVENAVFQNEFLYCKDQPNDCSNLNDEEEFMECSSCRTTMSSSMCSSEVASESCGDVDGQEDLNVADNCLSSTQIGQIIKTRSETRRRANTTCCLDLVSRCKPADAEVRFDLSWNPIVFDQLCQENCMVAAACSFNGGRSYTWGSRRCPRGITDCSPLTKCTATDIWEVTGVQTLANGQIVPFNYRTKNVVLATGSYDKPNRLEKPGENLDFVVHSLQEMELKMTQLDQTGHPILIVGAGLSAADAIYAALEQGHQVLHVFRRSADDPRLIFKNLPAAVYPEYRKIHRMMGKIESHPGYKPYAKHHVVKIEADKKVTLHGVQTSSHLETIQVSLVVVMIGSSPNLDFLHDEGRDLGIIPEEPISRNNLVDIDLFSQESVRHRGIYAMGPLVGDNFVRFLQGGALAITNHILKKKHREQLVLA